MEGEGKNLENGGTPGNGTEGANVEMQREIDRAVTKALATQKAKLDREHEESISELRGKLDAFESKGMTDAEKVAKQIANAEKAEKLYNEKVKRLEVNSEFVAMGVEEADYSPIVDDLFKGDFKSATSKISAVVEKKATELAEIKYNALAANIPDAKTGTGSKTWTRESFSKLTYSQQMAEISANPDLIKLI